MIAFLKGLAIRYLAVWGYCLLIHWSYLTWGHHAHGWILPRETGEIWFGSFITAGICIGIYYAILGAYKGHDKTRAQ